jgi:hypothetical protein
MPSPHIEEVELDQYAMGVLSEELLPTVEEHLLACSVCQARLAATDNFVQVFRMAATQLETRPVSAWSRILNSRPILWSGVAALAALSILFVETRPQKATVPPAIVLMQSLRGPEAGATVPGGRPFVLVFDVTASSTPDKYHVKVLGLEGDEVSAAAGEVKEGRVSASFDRLRPGSYWVRLYRAGSNEMAAEYALRAESTP